MRNNGHTSRHPTLGPRVQALRQALGFSLRDLASASGVSAPMLSQVERGETSPTLLVAERIAVGFGLSLSQLLRLDEEPHVTVVRASERRTTRRDGHAISELTPPLPGQRHAVTVHGLAPGAATGGPGDPPLHEPGSRETVVVSEGELALVMADARYELAAGDAVTFDADLPHHFENPGRARTSFTAVVTAGLRRA